MASFTDKTPAFNPYIQQQPVEAMVNVGMYKQQKYNQNLENIQATMSKVAGLNISRDVDKQYLKNKLSEATTKLQTFAAADLSNDNLSRSLTGMIAEVGGDEIVQNAVFSTQNYQNQLKRIKKAEEDGTLTPDNLYHFQKQASPWLNSTTPGESFNGQYVDYFDVLKHVRDTFDDIKPDEYTFDMVFKLDANGNPLLDRNGTPILSESMTRLEKSGLFPEKVQTVLNQIFTDPRVSQQLAITGQYNYRNYDDQQLLMMRDARRDVELSRYNDMIDQITLQKAFASEEQKSVLDSQIDAIKDVVATVKDSYSKTTDPDTLRGMLYTDAVKSNYTKMFTNVSTKTTIHSNPMWQAKFDLQKEANAQSRFAQQLSYQKERDNIKDLQWYEEYKLKVAKQAEDNENQRQENFITSPEQSVEDTKYNTIVAHTVQLENARTNYRRTSDELVYKTLLTDQADTLDLLIKSGLPREVALSQIVEDSALSRGKSKEDFVTEVLDTLDKEYNDKSGAQKERTAVVNDLYKSYKKAKEELKLRKDIDETASEVFNSNVPEGLALQAEELQPITMLGSDGKEHTLTHVDLLDIAIYAKGSNLSPLAKVSPSEKQKLLISEAAEAESRLRIKGKGAVLDMARYRLQSAAAPPAGRNRPLGEIDVWKPVFEVYKQLGAGYEEALEAKADYLRSVGIKDPNTVRGITTGKAETDKYTLANLKRMAGEEVSKKSNSSPTITEFFNAINKANSLTDLSIGQKQVVDEKGNVLPAIVINTEKGTPVEMVLTKDQARTLKIDLDIYDSPEVAMTKLKINMNKGTNATTKKDIGSADTYVGRDADYAFDTDFFPALSGFPEYDARMNIEKGEAGYYPYIFVRKIDSNGNSYQDIVSLKPAETPQQALNAARLFINTTNIETILRLKPQQ